ncbi:MAG: hypothetical protein AAGA27_08410 [Pseudomonadota bacterium]
MSKVIKFVALCFFSSMIPFSMPVYGNKAVFGDDNNLSEIVVHSSPLLVSREEKILPNGNVEYIFTIVNTGNTRTKGLIMSLKPIGEKSSVFFVRQMPNSIVEPNTSVTAIVTQKPVNDSENNAISQITFSLPNTGVFYSNQLEGKQDAFVYNKTYDNITVIWSASGCINDYESGCDKNVPFGCHKETVKPNKCSTRKVGYGNSPAVWVCDSNNNVGYIDSAIVHAPVRKNTPAYIYSLEPNEEVGVSPEDYGILTSTSLSNEENFCSSGD